MEDALKKNQNIYVKMMLIFKKLRTFAPRNISLAKSWSKFTVLNPCSLDASYKTVCLFCGCLQNDKDGLTKLKPTPCM